MAKAEKGEAVEKKGVISRVTSYIKSHPLQIIAILAVVLVVGGLTGYKFMHWMEEDETCGQICHNHQEFLEIYEGSAHQKAGVMCKDCHVGPWPIGWIKSQTLTNTRNIYLYYIKGGVYKRSFFGPDGIIAHTAEEAKKEGKDPEQAVREKFLPPMENCLKSQCHEAGKIIVNNEIRSLGLIKPSVGILPFHRIHIHELHTQELTEDGEWVSEMKCYDCHGDVMRPEEDRFYNDESFEIKDKFLNAITGASVIEENGVPITVCLQCHNGIKAPNIFSYYGSPYPSQKLYD